MNVIAVTSCATGIAHSYMAAESIIKSCEKRGHSVKVEIQGALGIENQLTVQEITQADLIIFANDVSISKSERFDGMEGKIITTKPHDIIKNPDKLWEQVEK